MTREKKTVFLPLAVRIVFSVLLLVSLDSCDIFSGLAKPGTSGTALVHFVEPVDGTIDLSLSATEAGRSAYVVFTTGPSNNLGTPGATATSVVRPVSPALAPPTDRNRGVAEKASDDLRAKARASARNQAVQRRPRYSAESSTPTLDYLGRTGTFKVLDGDDNFTDIDATCRYASGSTGIADPMDPVSFGARSRMLSIWVADDCWDGSKINTVAQPMVDALAEAFFGSPATPENSIYAWVTDMLGDEWGDHYSATHIGSNNYSLIPRSDSVTIMLADISADNTDVGGIVGYFYPVDTFIADPDSNERIMFQIDAVMFASPDETWDIDDYWPATVLSTLAHEFQHMIHFYQKGVLRGGDYFGEPTWIDELCSMQVEDLLADKMGVPGPRGIAPTDGTAGPSGNTLGRIPMYLLWPDISPLDWGSADSGLLSYYSWAYSFGAYLTRNYGGAELIRSIVQNANADVGAVIAAADAFSGRDESMESLLRRWGAAVLLSARTDAPEYYRYNTGGFVSSTVGTTTYKLGSISMYNYSLGIDTDDDDIVDAYLEEPYIFRSNTIGSMFGGAYSNAFMHLGSPSENPSWRLAVPEGMHATIVID
jgi:hypothetical protein